MVGSSFTAEELLNIENTTGKRHCVGPSPPSEPSSIVPRETPPEIDDAEWLAKLFKWTCGMGDAPDRFGMRPSRALKSTGIRPQFASCVFF